MDTQRRMFLRRTDFEDKIGPVPQHAGVCHHFASRPAVILVGKMRAKTGPGLDGQDKSERAHLFGAVRCHCHPFFTWVDFPRYPNSHVRILLQKTCVARQHWIGSPVRNI